MINVYIYCLLSVLSIVETTLLTITGHVGGRASFNCSNWGVWTTTRSNTKYLCKNQCSTDEDKLFKANQGETTTQDRITLRNTGKYLFVIINNLKKSDSGTYFCGLDRSVKDSYIKVHLDVKVAPITTTKMTTPVITTKMTITTSMLQHPDVSTTITVVSTTTMLSSSSLGTGLPVGLAVMLAVTVVVTVALLMFYVKRTRKPHVAVLSARNPTEDDEETHTNEETRGEDQSTGLTMSPVYSTINLPAADTTFNIYANDNDYIHQDHSDTVHDTVVTYEERVTVDLHPNQDTNMSQISLVPSVNVFPDEDFYSMAQLPKDQ